MNLVLNPLCCLTLLLFFVCIFQKIYADLGVSFSSESETDGLEKALANVAGVESYCIQKEKGILRVFGHFDPQAVATCVKEFEMIVQVLAYGHITG